MSISNHTWERIEHLIELAQLATSDVSEEIQEIVKLGQTRQLEKVEMVQLLSVAIYKLRQGALKRGDIAGYQKLEGNIEQIVNELIDLRNEFHIRRNKRMNIATSKKRLLLESRNGISVSPVFPTPWFHEKEIPMNGGFVETRDIRLWEHNDRLDIHIQQFRRLNGRAPDDSELLNIMLSKMSLPGISEKDEFKILDLARSIANNGVRRPPIIDIDGTLLDGNRRVTACNYILTSNEFTSEQKARVKYIFVWQLTEHATDDDRRRVVVSMNFEKDYKEDWPEYVKAQKIYEEWQAALALEPHATASRQREIKKELSQLYALGPDPSYLTRYIRMMEEVENFEAYHIDECDHDEYEVKHKSSKWFQYFDEITKKRVLSALDQDETLRKLVYDLLYQDKYTNWKQIRDLPRISSNEDARKLLREARLEPDLEEAKDKVVSASSVVQVASREARIVGANDRIKNFTEFLMLLPIGSFRDGVIEVNTLFKLKDALEFVNTVLQDLDEMGDEFDEA